MHHGIQAFAVILDRHGVAIHLATKSAVPAVAAFAVRFGSLTRDGE